MSPIHVHPSGIAATEAERDALFAAFCRAAACRSDRLARLRRAAARLVGARVTLAAPMGARGR